MSAYEHDHSDHTQSPDYAHGDERPSNASANPTFYDIVEARSTRRGFCSAASLPWPQASTGFRP